MPTFDIDLVPPKEFLFRIAGSSTEAGRDSYGYGGAIDFSAGGYWSIEYRGLQSDERRAQHYLMALAGYMEGSTNTIDAPFPTDRLYPLGNARIAAAALVHQSLITINVAGDKGKLEPGMIFSINHPTKGWRAYQIRLDGINTITTNVGGDKNYNLTIRPTLREDTPLGTTCVFERPLVKSRLPVGEKVTTVYRGKRLIGIDLPLVEALP